MSLPPCLEQQERNSGVARCRWHTDPEIGRFLVPGCWSRAVNGDDAPCDCGPSRRDAISILEEKVDRLERLIAALPTNAG